MKRRSNESLSPQQFGHLIEKLAPLNNRWREGNQSEKVLTLWAIGEILLDAVENPSDRLLWEIQNRSYITRTLLRYALIVRRAWPDQKVLAELVPGLSNFTVFREALPFLKGDREGIDESAYRRVVLLLKETDTRSAIEEIKRLKNRQIGRQHHKGSGREGIQELAQAFMREIQQIEERLRSGEVSSYLQAEGLMPLSQMAMAIAAGEVVQLPDAAIPVSDQLASIASILSMVIRGGRTSVSAFRQQVGAERLMQAADLLNSLRTEQTMADWQRRNTGQPQAASCLSVHPI